MKPDCTSPQEHIEFLRIICEERMFRIHLARKGSKHIILKSAAKPEAMTIELLKREYELGISLSHACIVSTLGFEEDTPVGPAIILEYIEGISLDEFLSKHPAKAAANRIIDDILDGVDYLHHRGILHNDLKPSNIVINRHGAARIIDFGLSISDDSAYRGCLGGSQGYSAPEILNGNGPSGAASDIYSIGILIKEITGNKYRKVIERCCCQDPSERYQNIHAIKRAIAFKRYLSTAVMTVILAIAIFIMNIYPKIGDIVTESSNNSLKNRLKAEMSSFYYPARDSLSRRPSYESAIAFKGEYLMQYIRFHDSIPAPQRLACEEIFAEQSAVLDSLMRFSLLNN